MKKNTRIALFFVVSAFFALPTQAQNFPKLDGSPADIAYLREDRNAPPIAKIIYSRPQKKGREIFGKLEAFGKVWRVGANEATEIRFYKDVTIGGKAVKAGTYSVYAIPFEDKWTMVLNTDTDVWGAYSYKQEKDVVRFDVPVAKLEKEQESLAIIFTEPINGASKMIIGWDMTKVEIPIQF
ncbi:MAG: DUF2911 domain-containing protein [Bacteroidetes Order II. Incertae sedis bacterium]|nr:DUF2911 domain-containing protein [Bacteroidetes Order II. bacterium]